MATVIRLPQRDTNNYMTANMKPISVALIGAGNIAKEHALALSQIPDARIMTLFDTAQDRAAELAKAYGASVAQSFEHAIEKCDIVWICTPQVLHEQQVLASLQA